MLSQGVFQLRESRLPYHFPHRQVTVLTALFAAADSVGHKTDLRPLPAGLLAPAGRFPVLVPPVGFAHFRHAFLEFRGHVAADGKLDPPKTTDPIVAIAQQVVLIARRVRPQTDPLHPLRQPLQRLFQDPQLVLAGAHVPVAKLAVEHYFLLGPVSVQRLIRLEPLVAVKRFLLAGLHQRGVHIQGGRALRPAALQLRDQVGVDPPQTPQRLIGLRDEGPPRLSQLLLFGLVIPGQIAEHRRRRRHAAPPFLAKTSLERSSLPPGQSRRLHSAQHARKSGVLLEHLQVADVFSARQVQQHQSHHQLVIRPSLLSLSQLHMASDRFHQPGHPSQIPVQRQTRQRRHPRPLCLGFVLVRKASLCYQLVTSLVFEQPLFNSYSKARKCLCQRGFPLSNLFLKILLTVDWGSSFWRLLPTPV